MIFINTRPSERATHLTTFLQARHINVVDMPLLALVKCELSELERHYLTQIKRYQAVIFISETAVRYFFEGIQNSQINLDPNFTVIAVGQTTAQTFTNFWQKFYSTSPNIITPRQFNLPENNEGLLQLPIIRRLKKGDNVLILKGKEGRALLKNTLIEKGIIVHEVAFYQRVFPSESIAVFQEFFLTHKTPEKIIVLITSLTAWQHWQKLLLTFSDKSLNLHYLVLQARIAETVEISSENFTVIADLAPITIAESLKNLS